MLHTHSAKRRVINFCILLIGCGVAAVSFSLAEVSFRNPRVWSGWTLFASFFVLFIYTFRKRLSTLPLGRVAHWLQGHIYLGLFCLFVFAMHIQWRIPAGWFEIALAVSLLGTIITGLVGLYWSRSLPALLTRLGDEVLYERIPGIAIRLRDAAEAKLLESVAQTGSQVLVDLYAEAGHQFFARPNFQWARLYRAYSPLQKLERRLVSARKLMGEEEIVFAEEIASLLRQKDKLDAHYTLQGALKHWLFVHLAFSLAVIPLLVLHILLVYNFRLA